MMKLLVFLALMFTFSSAYGQDVLQPKSIILDVSDPTSVGLSFEPTLPYTKTYPGPARVIQFYGGTALPPPAMPYLLSAYFSPSGAFMTGVPIIASNKRIDVDGEIQGVSALADGSEPSFISVSPDINGPSLAIEAHGNMASGYQNQSILAGYDIDSPIGGATSYSTGYGAKRFAIGAKGQMFWGSNLGTNPAANAEAILTINGNDVGIGPRLVIQGTSGETSLRINGVSTDASVLEFQSHNVKKWSLVQQNYTEWFGLLSPSGTWALRVNPTTNNIGIGKDSDTARVSVLGDIRATGSMQLKTAGQGVILKSPNGTVCKSVTIDNSGNLVLTTVNCP